jgi:thioredoxin reductase (NADPH)
MAIAKREDYDLLIVGSGPAGLTAAINAAANGLKVAVMDGSERPGGRAKESGAIENYPGFPFGLSGAEMMNSFVQQAVRFGAEFLCPVTAHELIRSGKCLKITSDDYSSYEAKAILLTMGLTHARLNLPGIGSFMGRGIWYGMPRLFNIRSGCKNVVVVGGANSAGQAVLRLARNPRVHVTHLVRRRLDDTMANYLIDRILTRPNITVHEEAEVSAVYGDKAGHLGMVELSNGEQIKTGNMYVFIGATPRTAWLTGTVALDSRKYVLTDSDYMTSMPGVFAAGDVRCSATNGVAAAVGEGFAAFYKAYDWLNAQE